MAPVNTRWLRGYGEMAARILDFDWAATPLGPIEGWTERFKLMIEQVLANPLVASLVCGSERVLIYNDAAARLYDNRHPEALGRPLAVTFPEGWATMAPFYERAFAGETVQVAGQPLTTRGEGEAIDVFDALLTPVREADGNVAFVHMTGSEIGARTREQAALRTSERRHRLLIENWAQAVWETDGSGVVTADSPSWRAYTGQTLAEWLGYGWLDAIHPEDRAYAERQWREAVAAQGLVDAEFRLRASDGGWRWTNVRAAPLLDAGGGVEKWVGANIDIDARKRAEAALRESEKRYRTLFEAMDEAYAVVEVLKDRAGAWTDFRFLEVNTAFVEHTAMPWPVGKTATELLGTPNPRWTQLYGQALDTDTPIRVEEDEPTLGRIFDLNIFALDRDRNRVAVLFTDITTRKRAEAALRESEERQAFLLKLSDALRSHDDSDAVADEACRLLVEEIGASRAQYTVMVDDTPGAEVAVVRGESLRAGDTLMRRFPMNAFGRALVDHLRSGRTGVVENIANEGRITEEQRDLHMNAGSAAHISVPRVRDGRLVVTLTLHDLQPRVWTTREISMVQEVAERTWAAVERARAEAALRESERALAADLANAEQLRSLAERLMSKESFEAIYDEVLATTVAIARADAGTIQIYDPETKALELIASLNFSRTVTDHFLFVDAGSRTACGIALKSGARAFVDFPDEVADLGCQLLVGEGIQSAVALPLVSRTGTPLGMLNAHWRTLRHRPSERELRFLDLLARQAADLIEQRQSQSALRDSEERLRQFGDASSDILWIRDAETLQWSYLTPAFETIYGLDRGAALAGDNMTGWLDLIVPEDRHIALANIMKVQMGERATFEYRIRRPRDGEVCWLRNTDFPMRDAAGQVRWLGGVGRDITKEKAAVQRQEVLVNELQHRSRNLLGVVTAVAGKTLRQGGSVDAFEERLQALSRAQALLSQAGSDMVEVGALVRAELAAHVQTGSERVRVGGPEVQLTARQVQNFALALHELTTNAVKYGALKDGAGWLVVTWEIVLDRRGHRRLALSWIESGVAIDPARPARRGYGTELIQEALAYALKADVDYEVGADGVRCRIEMPIT